MTLLVDAERRYPSKAHLRTHKPGRLSPYDRYRSCLRLEFSFTCAYCLSTETETALLVRYAGFEVEHFKPKSKFRELRDEYGNLLWTCRECNLAKGNTWPVQGEVKLGMRFIDPTKEGLGKYLRIEGDEVVPANDDPAASYMIEEINLNSSLHKRRRRSRIDLVKRITVLEANVTLMREAAGVGDTDTLAALEGVKRELDALLAQLQPSVPWDAPESCKCP